MRLLVSNPDQYQRGSVVDVPGVLTDIMADPARNRFYILRQDRNELRIFDGSTNQMIVALRTHTTPNHMGDDPRRQTTCWSPTTIRNS
ncbi:MAG: hypothetical protein WDO73_13370 [Ignavibacteriota bacterium]